MRQIRNTAAALTAIAALAACGNDDPGGTTGNEGTPTPEYKVIPAESGAIEAGRWAIPASAPPGTPRAAIDVPTAGFNGGERWIWSSQGVIGYWIVAGVHKDPCARSEPATSAGDTVQELADELDAQKLTTATPAEPVTIDGYHGLYVEVSTPTKLEYGTCSDGGLVIFDDVPAWDGPTVTRFWILDVDGQRVVLTVDGEDPVLADMVESAEFVEA